MKQKVHRISAKAIVVHEGKLLLTKKQDHAGVYYILPGGGQEHGESLDKTLIREVREETGYAIEPGDLVFVRDYIGAHHEFAPTSSHFHQVELYFEAHLKAGGHQVAIEVPDTDQIGVEWVPLEQISECRIYPMSLRAEIRDRHSAKRYRGDVN